MVASKAGHALLAATIAGGRPDGDRQHSWNVPPTPAPSLETQLPGSAFPAHRPVRFCTWGRQRKGEVRLFGSRMATCPGACLSAYL